MTTLPLSTPESQQKARIGAALLEWYQHHQRALPWRQAADPYAVWISEVMLQQTQVSTVIPYFQRWLRALPTVRALALSEEQEVLQLWEGLGYYSRARNLRRTAQAIVREHDGVLPRSVEQLRRLPGIGPYTAGAIASIAYQADEPLVDGNVIRVLTRLFAVPGDPTTTATSRELWKLAGECLVKGRARDFNQALMELGALVCTKGKPHCLECPVRGDCSAFAQGEQARFPEVRKRAAITPLSHAALWVTSRGRLLVAQLPANAPRWAGLWRLPTLEHPASEAPHVAGARLLETLLGPGGDLTLATTVQHSVTRYRVTLNVFRVTSRSGKWALAKDAGLGWRTFAQVAELPMPAAHRKVALTLLPKS